MNQRFLGGCQTWPTFTFLSILLYFLIYQVFLVNSQPNNGLLTSSIGCSENETTSLNLLFTSLQHLSEIYQDSFNLLANEIDRISAKLHRPKTSRCYHELSSILRKGFQTEWTAKCEYSFSPHLFADSQPFIAVIN